MFYSFLISHINEKSKLFNVWVEEFVKNMRLDPRTNLFTLARCFDYNCETSPINLEN